MSWDNDTARKQVFSALLIHQETLGEDQTIALLRHELDRLTVLQDHKRTNAEILRLTERCADLDMRLAAASEALEYYADTDLYTPERGKPAAILKDRGHTARDALETIADRGEASDDKEGQ